MYDAIIMMAIIIILTASYIGDDIRIVYALANTMRSFSVTNGRTNKEILGVGCSGMPAPVLKRTTMTVLKTEWFKLVQCRCTNICTGVSINWCVVGVAVSKLWELQ